MSSVVDCMLDITSTNCYSIDSEPRPLFSQLFSSLTGTRLQPPRTGGRETKSLSMPLCPQRMLGSSSPTLLSTRWAYCVFDALWCMLTGLCLVVLPQDNAAACIKGCMKEVEFMESCVVVQCAVVFPWQHKFGSSEAIKNIWLGKNWVLPA